MASPGKLIKPHPTSSKTFYQTPSPYERRIGYYRGVRHGNHIFISGTTAVDQTSPPSAPQILHPGDAAAQMRVALGECLRAVEELSGNKGRAEESVVRVRMYVSRKEDAPGVMEAYREMLGSGRAGRGQEGDQVGAAATLIVVQNGFVSDDMLVEVEVDAIVDEQ
ncbi:Endoribonuclease L-PSP family protein [Coccidioides posadasii C735 delta SOWgp]|uniref:WD repeat-containing protein n=2 Tax=Coccidioides posadasii TaxID=199306 RepID=A0A0J6IGL8_COCPO|nr:Endoribonuclease L-PSP family protein [Coccidioides posadasii C735 delta SOWgp]EER25582.1 Endoribonuclease L-PSP family protein [Coccidioides posadasii C735 delta SOWgp]KMM70977.1 WD repeat-containing protein [Coccidioides posadasii RMSCC 3488]|eukprot:XP_003067727.1 Endoribonuclease L-PSP family protein [Coccidioides posadasii C735 delta SOWgp]